MRRMAALALLLVPGCGASPPPAKPAAPAPQAPAGNFKALEAQNYVDLFATNDTQGWEIAKQRLVRLGGDAIPVLFKAMQERPGDVAFNCQDVLKRMGADALPPAMREIRVGDAGFSGKALARRRLFRAQLVAVIGEMHAAGSAAALAEILKDDPWETARRKAAFYLGESGDAQAVPALIQALRRETAEDLRATVLGALRRAAGRDLGPDPDVWEAWWSKRS